MSGVHRRQQDYIALKNARRKYAGEQEKMAKALKAQHAALRTELQPQIAALRREADIAATEFKTIYEQASAAYAGEAKALAKSLSLDGKAAQARCEALNRQANELSGRVKALQEGYIAAFEASKRARQEAVDAGVKAETARTTTVDVSKSGFLSNDAVETFLDRFPGAVTAQITAVQFDPRLTGPFGTPARGATYWDRRGHGTIIIGPQPQRPGRSSEYQARAAIAHEIGHVIYENFVSEDLKADWFVLHMDTNELQFARSHTVYDDEVEDFAECLRLYMMEDEALREHDKRKYKFIHDMFRALWPDDL